MIPVAIGVEVVKVHRIQFNVGTKNRPPAFLGEPGGVWVDYLFEWL